MARVPVPRWLRKELHTERRAILFGTAALLRLVDRLTDFARGTDVPAHWDDSPELDAAVSRHPAGKGLRPGDPS